MNHDDASSHLCTVLGFVVRSALLPASSQFLRQHAALVPAARPRAAAAAAAPAPAVWPGLLAKHRRLLREPAATPRSDASTTSSLSEFVELDDAAHAAAKLDLPGFYVSCNAGACCCKKNQEADGPPLLRSATGKSPIWRVKQPPSMHVLLTWNLPAHYVEVYGTFTQPAWGASVPLWWCPKSKCHWVDLHENVNPSLSGLMQFKFVVDGTWKCDPNYPICDDGSPNHHLNNVCVIFPRRLRLRLSNQRLRRRQSLTTTTTTSTTTWVCGVNSPKQTTPRHGRLLTQKKSRATKRTLFENCAPAEEDGCRTQRASELCSKPAWARFEASPALDKVGCSTSKAYRRSPTISGTGATTSVACRRYLIAQAAQMQSTVLATPKSLSISPNDPSGDDLPATAARRNNRNEARRREKQKSHLDKLVRCMSHHGGRRHQGNGNMHRYERTRVANWPSYITNLLHDPDVMLELFDLPKVLKMTNERLSLRAGWSMTAHPEKRATGGADAFYISQDYCVLALADGVGAWEQLGVNSKAFADELVSAIKDAWEDEDHPIHRLMHQLPPSLIARELMYIASKAPVSYGSATCCIAVLDPETQTLGICNLGDSGLCVLRRNVKGHVSPYFKTPEMTHFFNCPYQLSKTPSRRVIEKILGIKNIENGKGFVLPAQDAPKHGQCFDLKVEEGDLVLMASDGLWDNLWPWEISSLCTLALTPLEALILHDDSLLTEGTDIARALTEAASWKSQDPRSSTPFAKNYTAECGMPGFPGGKWDDVTVLAAWVSRQRTATREIYGVDGELLAQPAPVHPTSFHAEEWRWPYVPHTDGEVSD